MWDMWANLSKGQNDLLIHPKNTPSETKLLNLASNQNNMQPIYLANYTQHQYINTLPGKK